MTPLGPTVCTELALKLGLCLLIDLGDRSQLRSRRKDGPIRLRRPRTGSEPSGTSTLAGHVSQCPQVHRYVALAALNLNLKKTTSFYLKKNFISPALFQLT